MVIKIVQVRGGTKEEILNKKHNIFVGISLGNKWFTKENLKDYIGWALKYSKEKVLVLIADKIHAVNYEVRGKKSSENALKKTKKEGDKILEMVKEIIGELSKEDANKIEVVRWEDLETLPLLEKARNFFFSKFKKNQNFREGILDIVKNSVSWNFNSKEFEKLAEYVLNEFPDISMAFEYGGIEYGCYPYPINTRVAEFVEKIQKQEIFPEIKDKLKFNNMTCVHLEII